nr:MAG TPA: hypothetical protein [Caudoviricetes sp.]
MFVRTKSEVLVCVRVWVALLTAKRLNGLKFD